MTVSEHLKRIQNLPLVKRKIIFWLIIIVFGLILLTLFAWNVKQKIKFLSKEKFFEETNLPKLKKDIENLPKPELPQFDIEQNLKRIEEQQKEIKPNPDSQN
jgi:predicted PurR-regulated permease PerM